MLILVETLGGFFGRNRRTRESVEKRTRNDKEGGVRGDPPDKSAGKGRLGLGARAIKTGLEKGPR